ncbi:MAG: hypothetical protein ACJ8F7_00050 [Gemmataceae bacterium]
MALETPANQQYLTVVSEWSSYGQSGVRVGNAFPIFSLTANEPVENPIDEFPNPGGIFLVNRGECRVWDYVVTSPRTNEQYKNKNFRDCYYVAFGAPELFDPPPDQCKVAVLLDVPNFNIITSDNVIRNPAQNVTPIFFIRDDQHRIFGPLKRTLVQLDSMERIGAIHWAPFGSESSVYELSAERLAAQGCKVVTYEHPKPPNEVVARPIRLLTGPVWKVTSQRVHDRLSDAQLAEWYLRLREIGDVPEPLLKTLRTAPEKMQTDTPDVVRRRFMRLMQLFSSLEVLQTERQAIARKYLDSDDGKRMIDQRLEREVEQRAKELEAEVLRLRADLATEKKELAEQIDLAKNAYGKQVKAFKEDLDRLEAKRQAAERAVEQLKASMEQGVEHLGAKVRDQLPLLAAIGGAGRVVMAQSAGPVGESTATPAAPSSKPAWSSVELPEPTKDLAAGLEEPALVDRLVEDMRAEGLYFTRDFVANLYVLLKSAALNLVIGPPGYGKSSVVAALARALGHGNALLEIAVRRSWSDDRHLLGFYDSFHGRYDPGPTGLATRLLQAQRDWEEQRRGIYVVLLDEFNLSSPEYYFSQLLQVVTRPPEQPRVVRLFDAASLPAFVSDRIDQITIHSNVGFWGTINYDETTERLSPRLLDRTGMVFLTARDVLPGEQADTGPATATKGVRAKEVCGAWVRSASQCPVELWEQIEPYLDLLGQASDAWGPRLELSPRLLAAVRRYLANADGLLPPVKAVDFVFQQRVLPVLRGRGPLYANRVKALEQKLAEGGLERSARHVQEATDLAASQFGDIDFLAY